MIDRQIGYITYFYSDFDYAKDIRIYGMLGWICGMLRGLQQNRFDWTKKLSLRTWLGVVINSLLALLRDGLAYFFLVGMVLSQKMTIGDFVFLFGAVAGFSAWLNGIAGNVSDIVAKGIHIGYYREYFSVPDKYNHGDGIPLPTKSEGPFDIELRDVTFTYPGAQQPVIQHMNLKIAKGEKLAVVGTNGAGKTTLVKLLCGLYYPSEGEVYTNGRLVQAYNIENYYSLFSTVFQDMYLLPVSIREFVASCDDEIDDEKVRSALEKAGLTTKVLSLPDQMHTKLMKGVFDDSIELSGGEKQKLMLARALYKDAPFIILDEPTAALDPIAESALYQQYNALTEDKTAVYISHRLASTNFCDRIILIENGKITECGTHDELMALGGQYAYLFHMQSQYYQEEVTVNG
jgi:ABC-type multidrug transport system fused ATPase/permease subunit